MRLKLGFLLGLLLLSGCYLSQAERDKVLEFQIDEEWEEFVEENSHELPEDFDPEIIVYRSGYNKDYNVSNRSIS